MDETYSTTIDSEERERVLTRAEVDHAFRAIGQHLSEIADDAGLPEREIERVIGIENRDLIVLFRMFRMSSEINRRLALSRQNQLTGMAFAYPFGIWSDGQKG